MNIFVAGSMAFAKEILALQHDLQEEGHKVLVASDTELCVTNPTLAMDEDHCFEMDIMRDCMDRQEQCEAIIVLNYPKNGAEGYIGGHVLIELGLAYYLKQRIILLYPPPPVEVSRYSFEVQHMRPIILNGNLASLSTHLELPATTTVA